MGSLNILRLKKPQTRPRIKAVVLSAAALLMAVAGCGLYAWSQGPVSASLSGSGLSVAAINDGDISQSDINNGNTDARTSPTPNINASNSTAAADQKRPWQTDYFSTELPQTVRLQASSEHPDSTTSPLMGSYSLTSTAIRQSGQIGVTIGVLHNNSLAETSAVKMRASQPEEYAVSSRSYAPAQAIVFEHVGTYETDVFWQHGGQYAAVVASSPGPGRQAMEQALEHIISRWVWK